VRIVADAILDLYSNPGVLAYRDHVTNFSLLSQHWNDPMAVRLTCPECDHKWSVADDEVTSKVSCPECKASFTSRRAGARAVADRPTRFRDDEDDDRDYTRPRRRMSAAPDAPPIRDVSVLGIISLSVGAIGLLIALFPCTFFIGGPLAGIGLLLGSIGLIVSLAGKKSGVGLPIAGTAVSLFGVIVAVGWLVSFAVMVSSAQKEAEKEAERQEQEVRTAQAIPITATELHKQYNADEDRADKKYTDQVLEVTGVVHSATVGIALSTVELKTDNEADKIACQFHSKHNDAVRALTKGVNVTIRGRCTGSAEGDVTLENCILK
jgi:tRNA_anti-like